MQNSEWDKAANRIYRFSFILAPDFWILTPAFSPHRPLCPHLHLLPL